MALIGFVCAQGTYGGLSTSEYYSLTAAYKQEEGDRQATLEWEASVIPQLLFVFFVTLQPRPYLAVGRQIKVNWL